MHDTILMVEDEPNDVLLVQRAFRKANLLNPIQVVGEGEVAVAYLSGQAPYGDRARYPLPTLLLVDLKLPRMSGFEVLVWLRQQPGLKRLPVVVLTSSKESRDINLAYELGANSYLVKPVGFDDLLAMVKTLNLYWFVLCVKPEISLG
jgi:CheY-like chemotaxis protein